MKKIIRVGDFKIGVAEKKAVNEVLDSGRLSEGEKVRQFEKNWADYNGVKYAVATSSGTGALITALTAYKYLYGLRENTEVITSPLTYIADASAISNVGFKPVFVDIDPDRFVITPENIEKYFKKSNRNKKPRIILPVDLMGYPVEIDKVNKIAQKYNAYVLEDAAQAHGTKYQGTNCGSKSRASIFSFYIAHNIQAGEMGAILTDDFKIMSLSKKIKAQGRTCDCLVCTRDQGICPGMSRNRKIKGDYDPRFTHEIIGYNFKTMEFQAALAISQLKRISQIIKKRQENVLFFNSKLGKYKNILKLPDFDRNISYLAYPLVINNPKVITRKKMRTELEKRGIETRPLFGCIPLQQPAYYFLAGEYKNKLPVAEFIGENGFYIGCHQYLKDQDLNDVVRAFESILG